MSPPAAPKPDMINARRLIGEIRRELDPVEQEIRRHPYLSALEAGRARREDLTRFAGEQLCSRRRQIALSLHRRVLPQAPSRHRLLPRLGMGNRDFGCTTSPSVTEILM